jgi:hypothetical protein
MAVRRLALAAAFLIGCLPATSYPVRGPDGSEWWVVSCRRSQANCWREAGKRCPGGYDIADQSERDSTVLVANQYSATMVPVHRGELLVHCHGDPLPDQ